ncbi:MAG: LysR family transcriptional regulator substrate-binding protein, partial [Verrucomicrobia bacterium]|nr:LysR family transcriptional regulator substrate-binding protein [Verrucomicrobiota bacterium]
MLILGRMREIRFKLSDEGSEVSSVIRLASATSFIRCVLHDVLMEFMTCFPNVEVEVVAGDRNECLDLLSGGHCDVAVMVNMPDDARQLNGVHLFDDELYLLMSANHPLARFEDVPLHALCRESFSCADP